MVDFCLHSVFDRIRDSRDLGIASTHALEVFVSREGTADRKQDIYVDLLTLIKHQCLMKTNVRRH